MLASFYLFLLLLHSCNVWGADTNVPIGAIFDSDDYLQEIAFRYAVDRINMDRRMLPRVKLTAIVENLHPFDSFTAEKKTCNLTENGLGAIFGPQTVVNAAIVTSICETLEIPNILTHWDIYQEGPRLSLNIHPEPRMLSKAIADLVSNMNWKTFTILYDQDEALIYLQEVLKLHDPSKPPTPIRRLDSEDDHRPLLKELQTSGQTHIILHCKPEKLMSFLHQAKEVKMMEEYQSYLLTHLDAHTVDLADFKYGRTNITAVRLVDPTSPDVINAVEDWKQGELRFQRKLDISAETVTASAALMYDAVYLYATTFHDLSDRKITVERLNCDNAKAWKRGLELAAFMKLHDPVGLTGKMKFNEEGRRIYFDLNILELSRNGYVAVGAWNPDEGIQYNREMENLQNQKLVEILENKTFVVSSRLGAPYLMPRTSPTNETLYGNDRYEGFSMNLIDDIAKELKFKYVFEIVEHYGSLDKKTKQWDGIIRQLLDRKADLGICDLTITYEREQAVDFTMPFMTLGISILFSKPAEEDPDYFSFLSPFSTDVWMYMATAYLGVSLLLFILARTSPFEWGNPHPCVEECEELESDFNLVNCLWFSMGSLMGQGCDLLPNISPYEWTKPHPCKEEPEEMETTMNLNNSIWHNCGSLMQQGSDIAPKAVSTRLVAGMWWFFTLIMISSYTANLAAHLTINRLELPIKNVEDLSKQTRIKYGVMKAGSTEAFFKLMIKTLTRAHRAISTRMVSGMWCIFTLIMKSYTANLTAIITNQKLEKPITSMEDLVNQSKIKYGVMAGGTTAMFFQNSNFSTYQKMWSAMEAARPSVFTSSNAEGVERVLKGKRGYAFLMESTSIEYQVERHCDLVQIGVPLDSKGYGIAMPMNSPYRTAISGVVLKMQEDGRLGMMKEKWWKQMHGGGKCKKEGDDESDESAAELGLDNVGGVFLVLLLGCIAGFLMAVLEFLWNIRKIAVEEEITPKEALIMELKFAFSCKETTKPVRRKKGSSQSSLKSSSSSLNQYHRDNTELGKH